MLAKTVRDRILGADWWLSRCSGQQEWVHRDWQLIQDAAAERGTPCPRFAHCNFIHIVDTNDPERARAEQHTYFEQAMGAHRSREHLEKSYFFGSIDEIVDRLRDLADGGCEYVVLGPTSDDTAFRKHNDSLMGLMTFWSNTIPSSSSTSSMWVW